MQHRCQKSSAQFQWWRRYQAASWLTPREQAYLLRAGEPGPEERQRVQNLRWAVRPRLFSSKEPWLDKFKCALLYPPFIEFSHSWTVEVYVRRPFRKLAYQSHSVQVSSMFLIIGYQSPWRKRQHLDLSCATFRHSSEADAINFIQQQLDANQNREELKDMTFKLLAREAIPGVTQRWPEEVAAYIYNYCDGEPPPDLTIIKSPPSDFNVL